MKEEALEAQAERRHQNRLRLMEKQEAVRIDRVGFVHISTGEVLIYNEHEGKTAEKVMAPDGTIHLQIPA